MSYVVVVVRGMGCLCVFGVGIVWIDYKEGKFLCGGVVVKVGDVIIIDGLLGEVIKGEVLIFKFEFLGDFENVMMWVDDVC